MKPQHRTILIVEDDPGDRILIVKAFKAADPESSIHVVSDGVDAIDYIHGKHEFSDRDRYQFPTLITTDLKMPRADGFEVLANLKRNPECAIIPTVVLSSSSDIDDIRKSFILGASAYHIKPAAFAELRELIKELVVYWKRCEVPQTDRTGRQLPTESRGKMGERFPQ